MVAAKTENTSAISGRAAELLGYVRAHKSIFSPGTGFNSTHAALFRKNDTGKSLVPEEELETNKGVLDGVETARYILGSYDDIVESAKAAAKSAAPSLDDTAAGIVYADLAYYLRILSYATAAGSTDFLHKENLALHAEMYSELKVPVEAVVAGITAMKDTVLNNAPSAAVKDTTSACFETLASALSES